MIPIAAKANRTEVCETIEERYFVFDADGFDELEADNVVNVLLKFEDPGVKTNESVLREGLE